MHTDIQWDYENRIKNWITKISDMCNLESSKIEKIRETNSLVRQRIEELLMYVDNREIVMSDYKFSVEPLLCSIDCMCVSNNRTKRDIQNTIFLAKQQIELLLEYVVPTI